MRSRALLFLLCTIVSCIEQEPERCRGQIVLTDTNGVVTDHTGPGDYRNNQDCIWVIQPADKTVTSIQATFTKLHTEYGYDYVKLFDGPSIDSPPLAFYTGEDRPSDISSSGPSLTVQFTSDSLMTNTGFSLAYTGFNCPAGCSNHGTCLNGVCSCSLGWNGTYCNQSYCVGNCAPYGTCQNNQCVCLPGYYGANCNSSTCDKMTVLSHASGTFSDHRGGGDYQNRANCSWLIQPSPAVDSIHLDFTSFLVESPNDYVKIYDGTTPDVLIGHFSGWGLPPSVVATSGAMLIRFVSDAVGRYPGFTASYTTSNCSNHCSGNGDCIDGVCHCDAGKGGSDCSSNACTNDCWGHGTCFNNLCICSFGWYGPDCGECVGTCATSYCSGISVINDTSGVIQDHVGPGDYRDNQNCTWLIQIPDNYTSIVMQFTQFDLSTGDAYVIIYDGSQEDDPIIGVFTGNRLPPTLTLSGTTALVKFDVEMGAATRSGFRATFDAVLCSNHCNYHGTCLVNGQCQCHPGYNGTDCGSTYCIDKCSGHGTCQNNSCKCDDGFYGPSCSDTNCQGIVVYNAESGSFGDHTSGSGYLPFSNCGFLIRPNDNTNIISLIFTQFQTEFHQDYVSVYQGVNDAAPLLASLSGSWLPYPILAQAPLFVKFTTGPSKQFFGFRAQYSILSQCPNSCSASSFGCYNGSCLCDAGKEGLDCSENALLRPLVVDPNPINDTVSSLEWKYYHIPITEPVGYINITMGYEAGNPEAYLAMGSLPTRSSYLARSIYYLNPSLFFKTPTPGDYYLAVYGSDTRLPSQYTLQIGTGCPESCGNGVCSESFCQCDECWTGPFCTMKQPNCKTPITIAAIVLACIVLLVAVVVGGILIYLKRRNATPLAAKESPRSNYETSRSNDELIMNEMPTV